MIEDWLAEKIREELKPIVGPDVTKLIAIEDLAAAMTTLGAEGFLRAANFIIEARKTYHSKKLHEQVNLQHDVITKDWET